MTRAANIAIRIAASLVEVPVVALVVCAGAWGLLPPLAEVLGLARELGMFAATVTALMAAVGLFVGAILWIVEATEEES